MLAVAVMYVCLCVCLSHSCENDLRYHQTFYIIYSPHNSTFFAWKTATGKVWMESLNTVWKLAIFIQLFASYVSKKRYKISSHQYEIIVEYQIKLHQVYIQLNVIDDDLGWPLWVISPTGLCRAVRGGHISSFSLNIKRSCVWCRIQTKYIWLLWLSQ